MGTPYRNQSYTVPVSQLLDAEVCEDKSPGRGWPSYVRDFGLTVEHGPELIQMMGDLQLWNVDLDDPAFDAPRRAWQALAQLQYLDAIEPLLNLFRVLEEDTGEYDVLCEESADVLVRMGPESLPILQTQLIKGELPDWGEFTVIDSMKRLGVKFPETQAGSVEILRQRLEAYEDNNEAVNGWLVHVLVTFQAVEAAPLIEAAYAHGNIDDMFAGPWPQVQVDLGLKQESDFEPDELLPEITRKLQEEMGDMLPSLSSTDPAITPNATPKRGNPNPPPKFGDGLLSAPKSAKPKGKCGFGQGGSAGKKKKKKKKK